LNDFLRPEFINRGDEIVYFNKLTEENFRGIAALMLTELKNVMAERDMTLTWDDALLDYLTEKGYSNVYGARNLQRLIQKEIEDIVAAEIIDKRQGKVSNVGLTVNNGAVSIIAI
jgi:ATP-dependent Clp protease ATP-binding subunit ClpA